MAEKWTKIPIIRQNPVSTIPLSLPPDLTGEWDDQAVETFLPNFPDLPVYQGGLAELTVAGCMEMAKLSSSSKLDVLDGLLPCQEFAVAESSERLSNLKEGAGNS